MQLPLVAGKEEKEVAWATFKEQSRTEEPIKADPTQSWSVRVDNHVIIHIHYV